MNSHDQAWFGNTCFCLAHSFANFFVLVIIEHILDKYTEAILEKRDEELFIAEGNVEILRIHESLVFKVHNEV